MNNDMLALIRRAIYLFLFWLDKVLGRKSDLVVFCYHGISNDNWLFNVKPKEFKKQINYLKKNYQFITLSDLNLYLKGRKKITEPSVILTFDDGYKDSLAIKDYLKKLNIHPTMFLLSDIKRVYRKQINNSKKFLSRGEILSLKKAGWNIGSHGATHTDFWTLTGKQAAKEVSQSKKILEKSLSTKVDYFAYPRGRYTKRILSEVKKTGYKLGLTMDDGVMDRKMNPYLIYRVGIDRTHDFSQFKASFSPSVVKFRQIFKQTYMRRFL